MASATRDHRLLSLHLSGDGTPILRCIASDLTFTEAMWIVRSGLVKPRDVLISGYPEQFALWLDTHTCEDNGWSDQDRESLEGTITVWLHALRSSGALALTDMTACTTIMVARYYEQVPPLLFNYLQGLPPVADNAGVELGSDFVGVLHNAEAHSTRGLLRDRVDSSRLVAWMRGVEEPQRLTCLRIPLFGLATAGVLAQMQLRYAAWWQGDWRMMGAHHICTVRIVAVDTSGRLLTTACVTLGMTAWANEAVWAVLSNRADPVFDVHRDVASDLARLRVRTHQHADHSCRRPQRRDEGISQPDLGAPGGGRHEARWTTG